MKQVVIIGGGLGGLSAAVTLAHRGHHVTVVEKNAHFGGKMERITLGDYRFDFGPNTITMPHVFQQIIAQTGVNPDDYFRLQKLPLHTRNFGVNGRTFDFSSDHEAMMAQMTAQDRANFPRFLSEIRRLYELSEQYFFPTLFTSWRDYLSPSLGLALAKVRPFETLDHFFRRYFSDPLLLQALNRYATYIGSSPYSTAATFAMIAHLELNDGVYYAVGGNPSIAEGFVKRGRELGVTFIANEAVTNITVDERQANVVHTAQRQLPCDTVILNGDLLTQYPALVAAKHRPHETDEQFTRFEPSISAYVILAGVNTQYEQLLHHNVFFSDDYKTEFATLFDKRQYALTPTIYICNSSYTDKGQAPANGSNLFLLVNAPALTKQNDLQTNSEAYKHIIYEQLAQQNVDIRPHLQHEQVITAKTIATNYNAYYGALYGVAANKRKDAFLRPSNKAKDVDNLWFVGGSTHPGGGSPMVVLSGYNVANAIDRT